jgi:hypothetical protein
LKPGGASVKVLAEHFKTDEGEVSVEFKEMSHGWVTRGNSASDAIKPHQDKALNLTVSFIKKHTA